MMPIKLERINHNLIREISNILATEVKNPELRFLTVTDVKTTRDFSFAKVYIRVWDISKKDIVMKSLKNASGFVRKQLYDRVEMRHVPQIEFVYDDSIDYGKKIESIIENLN